MIKFTRVDHRLLHGQVVFKWSRVLDIDCILIANDAVAKDELRKSALRLAKPDNCKLVIKSMDQAVASIKSGVTDKYKMMILLETIEDAYRLITAVPSIQTLNLGGTRMKEGTTQISKAIFVSPQDIERLRQLQAMGVRTEIQMVPDDQPLDAYKELKISN